ncbi:hypothetical protein SH2C18_49380 [Clostridium sediminicola]|uniref:sigma-54 interaction domain-containing protein n=1 Tax=Clostridium sediminicola TaxID=3114879 RepID=UPI0031F25AB5
MNIDISEKIKEYENHIKQLEKELEKTRRLNEEYSKKVNMSPLNDNWVIKSDRMLEIIRTAMQIAPFPTSVLLTGEPGVGKDVICNFIHKNSKRSKEPFIKTNCSSLPENLFEAELFGCESRAITDSSSERKPGYFNLADKGTLLIDEIAELSINLQKKLLTVLQSGEVTPLGSNTHKKFDVRLIATTNKNLKQLVQNNKFNEELYNRLNVTNLNIPPLRERVEDIIPLANFFLDDFCKSYGFKMEFSKQIVDCFKKYHWPGNMRELKNLVENLVVTNHEYTIDIKLLPYHMVKNSSLLPDDLIATDLPLNEALGRLEKQIIENALINHGSLRKAAKVLGVSHSTLSRKLGKLDINL